MASERQVVAAIKAALEAQCNGHRRALDYDEADRLQNAGGLPDEHLLVTVEPRFYGGTARICGAVSSTGWRVTIRSVAQDADECRWGNERVARWEGRPIVDLDSTPVYRESATGPELDEGLVSALTVWTFTA